MDLSSVSLTVPAATCAPDEFWTTIELPFGVSSSSYVALSVYGVEIVAPEAGLELVSFAWPRTDTAAMPRTAVARASANGSLVFTDPMLAGRADRPVPLRALGTRSGDRRRPWRRRRAAADP